METQSGPILSSIRNLITNHKFPHAILLSGKNENFLQQYISLCCELLLNTKNAASHLDFLHITPSGKSWEIKIEQIRDAIAFAQKSPKIANNKIIFIEHADRLNKNSANSILKTLEEPTNNTFFILSSEIDDKILPTIKSRCTTMYISDIVTNTEIHNQTPSDNITKNNQSDSQLDSFLHNFQTKLEIFHQETNQTSKILLMNSLLTFCDTNIKNLGECFSIATQKQLFSLIMTTLTTTNPNKRREFLWYEQIYLRITKATSLFPFNVNFLTSLEYILSAVI